MGQQRLFLEIATKSRHRQVGQKWATGTKKWATVPKWAKNSPVVGNEVGFLVGNEARFLVGNELFWPAKMGQSGTEAGHFGTPWPIPTRQKMRIQVVFAE